VRPADADDELRAAAFAFLNDLVARTGGLVRRQDLRAFSFRDQKLSLEQNMRGIRFIRGQPALSILTTFRERPEDRPYDDDIGADGYPRYKWQGTNANAADNVSLREAMELRKPLVWFFGVAPGAYEPIFPVWIVDEEPDRQQFVIALDDGMLASWIPETLVSQPDLILRREYANAVVRRRLHQPEFRRRVLHAYRRQCAMCRSSAIRNCSMRHTSRRTRRAASPSSRMASRCALFITAPLTHTS
jgi:putative restriction endonuclease